MTKTVAFYTLGCRVNQYETAAMETAFTNAGYRICPFDSVADVYVINTCTVTAESDRKCRQILRRAKRRNPAAVVAAVGCMVQTTRDDIPADVIVGTNQKHRIVEAVQQCENHLCHAEIARDKTFEDMPIATFPERDRAFVKIQEGCDRFCSYCIIPYARGAVRSRDAESIAKELQNLADNGYCEVVLTGIHVASYGRGTGKDLADIIALAQQTDGISRIRLSSVDPAAFTDDFIARILQNDKLCPHFHISLQSGADTVLRRMNRRYTTADYADVLQKLRAHIPDVSITTDVITGFPGETEDEFAQTCEFVRAQQLCGIHVFPYSARTGTAAADFPNQVPQQVREERARALIAIAAELRHSFALRFVGRVFPMLTEHKEGNAEGYIPNYIRVVTDGVAQPGTIVNVEITDCEKDTLYGRLI